MIQQLRERLRTLFATIDEHWLHPDPEVSALMQQFEEEQRQRRARQKTLLARFYELLSQMQARTAEIEYIAPFFLLTSDFRDEEFAKEIFAIGFGSASDYQQRRRHILQMRAKLAETPSLLDPVGYLERMNPYLEELLDPARWPQPSVQ